MEGLTLAGTDGSPARRLEPAVTVPGAGLPAPPGPCGRRSVLTTLVVLGGLMLAGCGEAAGGPLVLDGVVVDAAGRPVADARVALTAAPTEVPDTAALTGVDGRFALSVPMPGSYRVTAFSDTGRAESTVDVDRGRPSEVRLVLRP